MRLGRNIIVIYFCLLSQTAQACHKYSIWHYPWTQKCDARVHVVNVPQVLPPIRDNDIPLPSLDDNWNEGAPDDELKARLMLRGLLEAK
jgi:hypothetical protein